MRVTVDEELCAATGQCELICPEVFEVDLVSEVKLEAPEPALHDRVREAADSCPTGAILLHDS
ncbi:MAG: ferredoxin [Acidimicrobiia bacterium]